MPIEVRGKLSKLTQQEFASIAFKVMNQAFSIYNEIGSLVDESVYRKALLSRLEDAETEVQVDVRYKNFLKSYFIDVIASGGGIFELKAVKRIDSNHKSQLLNYLLLTGMHHGKLINFGPVKVEHEFVNTRLTHSDRILFTVDDKEWIATEGFDMDHKNLVLDLLRDWGTGLECTLYKEALFHFLGGEDRLLQKVGIFQSDKVVAQQVLPLCNKTTAIHITSYQDKKNLIQHHLMRLMNATGLKSVQWINIARKQITFRTLHRSAPHSAAIEDLRQEDME